MLNVQEAPVLALLQSPRTPCFNPRGTHFCTVVLWQTLVAGRQEEVERNHMALKVVCLKQVRKLFRDALQLLRELQAGTPARDGTTGPTWALVQADGASRTFEAEGRLFDSFPLLGQLFTVESILLPKLNASRVIVTLPSTPKAKVHAVPIISSLPKHRQRPTHVRSVMLTSTNTSPPPPIHTHTHILPNLCTGVGGQRACFLAQAVLVGLHFLSIHN